MLTALPLENIMFTVDGMVAENIRDYTVNIAGWQASTNAVFINKLTNWHEMHVEI